MSISRGGEGEIGGKQEDGTALRMAYDHEAHDARGRTPDHVQATIAQSDVVFPVDRAGHGSKCGIVLGQILETDLVAVDPRPAPWAARGRGRREISDRIALGPCYELMPIGEQLSDKLSAGVVGIGHEQNLATQEAGNREQ